MKAPPLKDDCFAMPPGVDWTPVDDALERLRSSLHAITDVRSVALSKAGGRILAKDVIAKRSNPPYANSAVDGFGFAFAHLTVGEVHELPLVMGRAAAGAPFLGTVPPGFAIRILTGARVPEGVDTVVLEEDCSIDDEQIAFRGGLKAGANTRCAGEDVLNGDLVLPAGQRLRAQDLALLAAVGISEVSVRQPLRVGVLSTGDEVVPVGQSASPSEIYDANRPMLLEVIRRFGFEAVDLGHVADDEALVRAALNEGSEITDAILTSGGASAGDEDHVSAVLAQSDGLQTWRIAVKPGRPLAMAVWNGVPVFGLPGNPVAALVCTLIFAKPALGLLAGLGWQITQGFSVPAGFAKNKKGGRREYLRARIENGVAKVFKSEGSGRISGLSWSDGLVELPDGAKTIEAGDMVTYYPYASFGL